MNLALWIIAIVLAVAFAASALMKQVVPENKWSRLARAGQGASRPNYYPTDRTC